MNETYKFGQIQLYILLCKCTNCFLLMSFFHDIKMQLICKISLNVYTQKSEHLQCKYNHLRKFDGTRLNIVGGDDYT